MKNITALIIELRELTSDRNIFFDYNPTAGGYRLEGDKGRGLFNESSSAPRLCHKEICIRLQGIIDGITYARNNK